MEKPSTVGMISTPTAVGCDLLVADHGVDGVVAALDQNVGLESADQLQRGCPSSKSTTASTAARAAMTRARSRSPTMGRVGPLRRLTEASVLRPRMSLEPKRRQSLEQCDVADMKQIEAGPFVKTMVSPEARHSAARVAMRSRSRSFSVAVRVELRVSAAMSSCWAMGTGADLAHDDARGKVGEFDRGGDLEATGDARGQGGDDGVAGAGDVETSRARAGEW